MPRHPALPGYLHTRQHARSCVPGVRPGLPESLGVAMRIRWDGDLTWHTLTGGCSKISAPVTRSAVAKPSTGLARRAAQMIRLHLTAGARPAQPCETMAARVPSSRGRHAGPHLSEKIASAWVSQAQSSLTSLRSGCELQGRPSAPQAAAQQRPVPQEQGWAGQDLRCAGSELAGSPGQSVPTPV